MRLRPGATGEVDSTLPDPLPGFEGQRRDGRGKGKRWNEVKEKETGREKDELGRREPHNV